MVLYTGINNRGLWSELYGIQLLSCDLSTEDVLSHKETPCRVCVPKLGLVKSFFDLLSYDVFAW